MIHYSNRKLSVDVDRFDKLNFLRDFSITTNRGMTVRVCGKFYFEAQGFDGKKLHAREIDWYNDT